MQTFVPWESYPSLTLDRLMQISSAVKTARDGVVPLHDPIAGDNRWAMHCRGYSRQCHAIRALALEVDWLEVSSQEQENLELSLRIGDVPLKIVRSDPDDVPYRHRDFSRAEQMLMTAIVTQLPPGPLRLIAVTDVAGLVESMYLVEFDSQLPVRVFQLPIDDSGTYPIPTPDPVPQPPIQPHDKSSEQDSASA
jgi:hypothetical protein